jgi:Glycoside hydrolase family 44
VVLAVAAVVLVAASVALTLARQTPVEVVAAGVVRRINVVLSEAGRGPAPPPARVNISVDARTSPRPISPLIYGVAHADQNRLEATGAHLNRWGGNPNTRYNWVHGSAWNAARDWEFRNYGGPPSAPSSTADAFVATNRELGVPSVITVPAIGWVARDGVTETRSVNVPAVGGPPLAPGSDAIDGYDPAANRATTSVRSLARKPGSFSNPANQPDAGAEVYQDEWVHHLVSRFGSAAAGGVSFYVVDNEPDLWSVTHTDVHPVEPSYDDMLALFLDYAIAIKDMDPTARVLGPAASGWIAYQYSARDRGADNFRTHADRRAHGDMPFLPWWLDQLRRHDEQVGRRTLDVLDVHYYPQAGAVFSDASDAQTNALRLRSTRSLWDPDYVDESWIAEPVRLIPRLREWIDRYYPGTLLAINEWNWGADRTVNGALAIADVLGIFGREGVGMAAYWTVPQAGAPGEFAFAMYTNYDGQGHGFGDEVLGVRADAPDEIGAYASRDSATGDVLIIAVNRRADADIPLVLRVDGSSGPTRTQGFRYSAREPLAIEALGVVQPEGVVLPAESITLLRVSASRGQ